MTTPTITVSKFSRSGGRIILDADCDGTAEKDVMQGPCRVTHISVDNTANAFSVFYKMYNNLNPTIGTDDPIEVYQILASEKRDIPLNPPKGVKFSVGLSIACVTTTGGTAGAASPGASVPVALTCLEGLS
jgi:hypothetical protein